MEYRKTWVSKMANMLTELKHEYIRHRSKKLREQYYFDYTLLAVVILLLGFGLVMLYSISSYTAMIEGNGDMFYFKSQLKNTCIGLVGMTVITLAIPYHWYRGWKVWALYALTIILMLLVLSPLGVSANGARRWIDLGVQFQPSEFAKLSVVLFISHQICRVKDTIDRKGSWMTVKFLRAKNPRQKRWYHIVRNEWLDNWLSILVYGVILSAIVLGITDNLSTAIIVAGMLLGVLSIVSKYALILTAISGVAGIGLVGVIKTIGPDFLTPFIGEFRVERIQVWLQPENYSQDGGYQILQGLYAVGSGGWFGKGLGNGTQKLTAIPEVQNDYIIAAIIEELGIVGAIIILSLFLVLLYRLYVIARHAPDLYGSLIVSSVFIHIAIQVIFNIGVVTAILPNTGVTLPFISYGGTAMIFLLAEVGLALQVSSHIKIPQDDKGLEKSKQ